MTTNYHYYKMHEIAQESCKSYVVKYKGKLKEDIRKTPAIEVYNK